MFVKIFFQLYIISLFMAIIYSLMAFYRAMHHSAKRGIACRLTVCNVGGSGSRKLEILELHGQLAQQMFYVMVGVVLILSDFIINFMTF